MLHLPHLKLQVNTMQISEDKVGMNEYFHVFLQTLILPITLYSQQNVQRNTKINVSGPFGCLVFQLPQVTPPFDPLGYPVPETWQQLSSSDPLRTCSDPTEQQQNMQQLYIPHFIRNQTSVLKLQRRGSECCFLE